MVELLKEIALRAWDMFFVAAPFVVLGLAVGGILHVLLSRRLISRWLGQSGMLSVTTAAAFGIPLPLCSCGVVPVSIALGRKGASRPAILSFLITTPESGADSILLTWGLLGPVMAVARPVASFFTAMIAGILAIALPERPNGRAAPGICMPPAGTASSTSSAASVPARPPAGEEAEEDEQQVVGFIGLWRSIRACVLPRRGVAVESLAGGGERITPLSAIVRNAGRYAFIDLLDDLVFWFAIGVVVAGVIAAVTPNDLAQRGLGGGIAPMLLLLVIGIPMYMCASASTPIAAALVAKGVSPGAALVFLLSGPATNATTIVILGRQFGTQFVRIYLISIAVVSLAAGIALDALIGVTGRQITAATSMTPEGVVGSAQVLIAFALAALMLWRLAAGAAVRGVSELRENVGALLGGAGAPHIRRRWFVGRARQRTWRAAAVMAALVYLLSGVHIIQPDARGYGFLFGRLVWPDLGPGIHYVPPVPFGRCDVWRVGYPRKSEVGFRTTLGLIANRRELLRQASAGEWHSPIATMNPEPQEAAFLAADENLLEMSFSVHYGLSNPTAFFYRVDKNRDLVGLYAQAAAREFVARTPLDELLTTGRERAERFIAEEVQRRLDAAGAGVAVESVHIVDLHPPQDAVYAFRDVSSAREERETRIHTAMATLIGEVPRARGHAAVELATAQATAAAARTTAAGRAQSFMAQAEAASANAPLIRDVLWLETAERVLANREKFIIPPGTAGGGLVLWREGPAAASNGGR